MRRSVRFVYRVGWVGGHGVEQGRVGSGWGEAGRGGAGCDPAAREPRGEVSQVCLQGWVGGEGVGFGRGGDINTSGVARGR